jgi:hypothetical protein
MRSAGVGSSHNSPDRIIPQRGKVAEYSVKPPRSEHWAVLHEREPGLYLANDPGHLGPQSASLSVKSVTLSGNADVLAGEASGNDVNVSPPWLAIERSHIVPHGEGWQHSVPLPGKQDAPWVGSKFNSADGAPSKDVSAQDASSCSCEQGKFTHWLKCQLIHLCFLLVMVRRAVFRRSALCGCSVKGCGYQSAGRP